MNKRLTKASKLFLTGPTQEDPHLSSPPKDGVRSSIWNGVLVITLDDGVYPEYRSSAFHKISYFICLNYLAQKSQLYTTCCIFKMLYSIFLQFWFFVKSTFSMKMLLSFFFSFFTDLVSDVSQIQITIFALPCRCFSIFSIYIFKSHPASL